MGNNRECCTHTNPHTVYAHWSGGDVATVTYKYKVNDTWETWDEISTPMAGKYLLPKNDPQVQYKTFVAWYKEDTFVNKVDENTNFDSTHTTIYAKFDDQTVKVTFDANGGKFTDQTTSHDENAEVLGGPYTLDADYTTPTYEGKDFQGWFTDSQQGTQVIIGTTDVTNASDHKLYAHWKSKAEGDVQFMVDGTEYTTIKQYSGDKYILPPDPSKDYKTFDAWYTTATFDADSKIDPATTIVPSPLKPTVYAHFNDISVTVKFDANGGT